MNNTTPIKMPSRGYYTLSKVDSNGNPRTEGCPSNSSDNIVTYVGAYQSLIVDSIFETLYAALGTSTTERTRNDTSLGIPDSGRSSGGSGGGNSRSGREVDNQDGTSTVTITRTMPFSLGAKVGTFSEVGLYDSGSTGVFIAGQLIKDEFGSPTTVTILSDEQLIVTYTLEWTIPNTSNQIGTGTVTDSDSNSYSYEIWAQPYFEDYNGTSDRKRYFWDSSTSLTLRDASGIFPRPYTPIGNPWSLSINSSGVVTAISNNDVASPTSFSQTDISYIGVGGLQSQASNISTDVVDTVLVLGNSTDYNANACYVYFPNPLSKTNQQSFSIQVEMQVQV